MTGKIFNIIVLNNGPPTCKVKMLISFNKQFSATFRKKPPCVLVSLDVNVLQNELVLLYKCEGIL